MHKRALVFGTVQIRRCFGGWQQYVQCGDRLGNEACEPPVQLTPASMALLGELSVTIAHTTKLVYPCLQGVDSYGSDSSLSFSPNLLACLLEEIVKPEESLLISHGLSRQTKNRHTTEQLWSVSPVASLQSR